MLELLGTWSSTILKFNKIWIEPLNIGLKYVLNSRLRKHPKIRSMLFSNLLSMLNLLILIQDLKNSYIPICKINMRQWCFHLAHLESFKSLEISLKKTSTLSGQKQLIFSKWIVSTTCNWLHFLGNSLTVTWMVSSYISRTV